MRKSSSLLTAVGIVYCVLSVSFFYKSETANRVLIGLSDVGSSTTDEQSTSPETFRTDVGYNFTFKDVKFQFNYTYLPVVKNCDDKLLLAIILSSPESVEIRQAIRESWANAGESELIEEGLVKTLFLVGTKDNSTLMKDVVREAEEFEDLIVSSANDTYTNLIFKTLTLLHYHSTFCPARFLLKVDQDVVFHFDRFAHHVKTGIFKEEKPEMYGKLWTKTVPFRDEKHKWYISEAQFTGKLYPPFCSGPAYVVNRLGVPLLLAQTNQSMMVFVEDVFVTGILAERANVKRIHAYKCFRPYIRKDLFTNNVDCDDDQTPYLLSSHGWKTVPKIKEAWSGTKTMNCTRTARWW